MSAHVIDVYMVGHNASLRTMLLSSSKELQTFERSANASSAAASRNMMMWGTAAKVGVLAAVAAFAIFTASAISFERDMRNVNSISHLTEQQLKAVGREVLDLSTKLPQTAGELAGGLYEIASSGFTGAKGLTILEQAAIGASAGMTDTKTSAKGILAVLNAYGMEAEEAAHVTNVLFQGVNVGILTFEELSNSLGKYMNTAAAANVTVEESTAALATMTLSGINSYEAATSLNRVLQSLIKTSVPLREMLKGWGFESGEAALQTLGLKGVMDKLRETTGGNITQMLKLFPEIRAVRGALALMADEGRNYERATLAMTEADKGQGAAKRALEEQLKSVSAQWKIFTNWLNTGAVAIGTKMLPLLLDMMSTAKALGGGINDLVQSNLDGFFERLASAAADFEATGEHLIDILGDMWDAGEPFVALMLKLVGGAVLLGITGLAASVETITRMLSESKGAVTALTVALIALGTIKTIALLATLFDLIAIRAFSAFGAINYGAVSSQTTITGLYANLQLVGLGFIQMGTDAELGFGMVTAGISGAAAALAAFAPATLIVGIISAFEEVSSATAELKGEIEALKPPEFNPNSVQSMKDWSASLGEAYREAKKSDEQYGGLWDTLKGGIEVVLPGVESGMYNSARAVNEFGTAAEEAGGRAFALQAALDEIARLTGMTPEMVNAWLAELKLDPLGDAAWKIADEVKAAAHESDIASRKIARSFGIAGSSATELAGLTDKANKEFEDQVDIVFDLFDALGKLDDANQNVAEAMLDIADAQRDEADAKKEVEQADRGRDDAARQLADANREVEDSIQAVADARKQAASAQRDLVDAQKEAAQAVLDIKTAEEELATARREATGDSKDMRDALQEVEDAENALRQSQQDSLEAQQALTDARDDYGQTLQNLIDKAAEASDSVVEAEIAIREAEAKLAELRADPTATQDDITKAEIAVDRAERRLRDLQQRAAEAQAELDRNNDGPDTSDAVRAAADAADEAARREAAAAQAVTDAQQQVEDVRVAAAQAVTDAENNLAEAIDNRRDADQRVLDARDAVEAANRGIAEATRGVEDANRGVADAQIGVNDAQARYVEAQQGVVDAHAAITGKVREYEDALFDAALAQYEVDKKTLGAKLATDNFVTTLGILEGKIDPSNPLLTRLQGLKSALDSLDGQYVVDVAMALYALGDAPPGMRNAELQNRWGGIMAFAGGGTTPAHITKRQRIKYGEPETGGEAYIPKYGLRSVSEAILAEAAGWYGGMYVPAKDMAAKGGGVPTNKGPTPYNPSKPQGAYSGHGPAWDKTDYSGWVKQPNGRWYHQRRPGEANYGDGYTDNGPPPEVIKWLAEQAAAQEAAHRANAVAMTAGHLNPSMPNGSTAAGPIGGLTFAPQITIEVHANGDETVKKIVRDEVVPAIKLNWDDFVRFANRKGGGR